MGKRGRKKKSSFGLKLQSGTIYILCAATLFGAGAFLFASFVINDPVFDEANTLLTSYFGFLSALVAVNLIMLSFLFTKIRTSFTRPNVPIGLLTFSAGLIGLFRSGEVGKALYGNAVSLFGPAISILLFSIAVLLGLIVMFNITISQLLSIFTGSAKGTGGFLQEHVFPLFKTKKRIGDDDEIPDLKQPVIRGLGKEPQPAPVPAQNMAAQAPVQPPKNGKMPAKAATADDMILNKPLEIGVWEYPPTSLLSDHKGAKKDSGDVKKIAGTIERTLQSFGIQARVAEINVGPSVTQYALEISLGTKLSKITSLANDLALATEAPTGQIRIEAPIPGRNLVGVEIPNRSQEIVSLKSMLESPTLRKTKSKLAVPMGLDVSGNPIVADIGKMPHVLVAGTTGSGKSVLMNVFIMSLLFRASPNEVKMIMIDPKRVELTAYNDIPHLLSPVVVEADKSVSALKWALKEMDKRYIKFSEAGVRNIDSYNELAGFQALPYIVIFMDELADLMALAPVEVEDSIARIAQMARATGIHLVLATQRPSVDVITGLIKANVPSRIAFNVSSMIDSKVIIDTPGAEKLLGKGDMLFVPPDQAKPTRIQGSFVSDQDTRRLVNFIKSRGIPVEYTTEVVEQSVNMRGRGGGGGAHDDNGGGQDPLFADAVRHVVQYNKASSSHLQRRFRIGFNRAARLIDELEASGVIGGADGSKPREVLITNPDEFLAQMGEQ